MNNARTEVEFETAKQNAILAQAQLYLNQRAALKNNMQMSG